MSHGTKQQIAGAAMVDAMLDGLTPPQREAVTHVDGPLLVLAGPGSGKTRVITGRVAHLVRGVGIPPWHILAITFTNKAAGEMRHRLDAMLDERDARKLTIATFHSLCARLLRIYANHVGLPAGYSIYDSADQKNALKQAMEELQISSQHFTPAAMLSAISNAKNELHDAAAYSRGANDFYTQTVAKIYKKYEVVLKRNAAVDFDDLLLKTAQLFHKHPDVLEQCRQRYQYILIDEYQDTNHAQFIIANALAATHHNICATGDPDQSIYGWRGANIQNILEFEAHYPNARVVRLEQNYRSTKTILHLADTLIRNNHGRKHKALWTDNDAGEPAVVMACANEREEADWVVQQFKQLHDDDDLPWGAMAVFYRMNSLSRVMEDALREASIPYQIARGTAFYDRKEIRDIIAFLRVVANPADEVNLLRIINTPARGISAATVKTMQAYAYANNCSLKQVIDKADQLTNLNTRAQNAVGNFAAMLNNWQKLIGNGSDADTGQVAAQDSQVSLRNFVEQVMRESGLYAHYENDKSDPDQERLSNLGEFISFTKQFEDDFVYEIDINAEDEGEQQVSGLPLNQKLLALLERISLVSDVDAVESTQGSVTLMTLHAAKGLEYPAVAIIGMEQGLLPHSRSFDTQEEMEEERRLAFVGITRAMQRLFLTLAKRRTIFGQSQLTMQSQFISELPSESLITSEPDNAGNELEYIDDFDDLSVGHGKRNDAAKLAAKYPPGTLVEHDQFGLGRIIECTPLGARTRARVDFQRAGRKTIILQYTNLTIIDLDTF